MCSLTEWTCAGEGQTLSAKQGPANPPSPAGPCYMVERSSTVRRGFGIASFPRSFARKLASLRSVQDAMAAADLVPPVGG